MGHHISGVVIPGDIVLELAARFDAKVVPLRKNFTAIALCGEYVDAWADRLDIHGDVAPIPMLNTRVVHHIAISLAGDRPFAIIQTDYFGGNGSQWAAAYCRDTEIMAPSEGSVGPINSALRAIGFEYTILSDAFTAVGLANHRYWDDLFEEYWDG